MKIMNRIRSFFVGLREKWKYRKIRKYLPKTVDVHKSTEKDLQELGRATYVHKRTDNGAILIGSSLVPIRNKKNGRVIMFSGSLEKMKSMFGEDYEMVESAIKEPAERTIDI